MATEEDVVAERSMNISELSKMAQDEGNKLQLETLDSVDRSSPSTNRAQFWQICLNIFEKNNAAYFDEIYDLPEQTLLRENCQEFVDKLGNDDEDKVSVVSDLESVITSFCKLTQRKYDHNDGWLEVLAPLVALKLPRRELYNCFQAIMINYIPRNCNLNNELFHLFRLLILYHDPELCSFLDTKKITPDKYSKPWFRSLFAAVCNLQVVHSMWDVYFQQEDPFFIFFLALVILMNTKEQLMTFANETSENIIELLQLAPTALEAEDIDDFCSLAKFYATRTPQSFKRDYYFKLFGDSTTNKDSLLQPSLCLSVSINELLSSSNAEQGQNDEVRFFIIDCRPAEQYNSGHLCTAFHLDASLMLQEPLAFSTAMEALLTTQKHAIAADSAAAGEHLCFLGSGREEEDQYVHMVVASFLQKHTQYVSMANEGYIVLHELVKNNLSYSLTDHSNQGCIVCNPEINSQSLDTFESEDYNHKDSFLGRLSSVVKSKTAEVTDKIVDYIQNTQSSQPEERHVSSKDKLGKRYRNMASVFTIDDDLEGESIKKDDQVQDVISVATWLKKPEVVGCYRCHQVADNGYMYSSWLVVMDTHLYVLRELPDRQGLASVMARRALASIVKITSKRKHPELITFKYGLSNGESFQITASDRLLIPQAGDATKLVKQQIVKIFE